MKEEMNKNLEKEIIKILKQYFKEGLKYNRTCEYI